MKKFSKNWWDVSEFMVDKLEKQEVSVPKVSYSVHENETCPKCGTIIRFGRCNYCDTL